MEREILHDRAPSFSIIIPTYNRPKQLAACLQALAKQNYARDCFEVVVVDDGSKKSLEPVVARFANELQITLHRRRNKGPAAARNTGADHAKGEFLAFIDDDCHAHANWLDAMARYCTAESRPLVGGHTINSLPHNLFSTASQQIVSYLYRYYNGQKRKMQFFASNNMVLPADKFREIGGFDTSFKMAAGEDRELCDRWLCAGFSTSYAPEAIVRHAHSMTWKSYIRQHFNYGRGSFWFHRKRFQRARMPLRIEPGSFYRDLLLYPLAKPRHLESFILAGLIVVSQFANIAGFFWEVWKQRGTIENGITTG